MNLDIERAAFEAARQRGAFKLAPDACPTWLATQLREEGWQARAAEGQAEATIGYVSRLAAEGFLHDAGPLGQGYRNVLIFATPTRSYRMPVTLGAAPLPRQAAEGLRDTDRMDLVAKSGVRGSTYKGITSINVIVHEDDLLCGGARYAIDCMIERDSAAPTVKAGQ